MATGVMTRDDREADPQPALAHHDQKVRDARHEQRHHRQRDDGLDAGQLPAVRELEQAGGAVVAAQEAHHQNLRGRRRQSEQPGDDRFAGARDPDERADPIEHEQQHRADEKQRHRLAEVPPHAQPRLGQQVADAAASGSAAAP